MSATALRRGRGLLISSEAGELGPLDVLAFSSALAGGVAAALVLACGLAIAPGLGARELAALTGLAGAGTLVVYNVDRLRDLERDATTTPLRTRFIHRRRREVVAVTGLAAAACLPLAWLQPWRTWALCAVVLGLGLLHRRLKRNPVWKVAYVTFAWLAIAVGLPAARAISGGVEPAALAWTCGVVGLAIAANLIASDLRDAAKPGGGAALVGARALCLGGVALAALAGGRVWPLLAIPLCEGLSLLRFRPDERYGLVVVDGALLLGAIAAAAILLAR